MELAQKVRSRESDDFAGAAAIDGVALLPPNVLAKNRCGFAELRPSQYKTGYRQL